MTAHCAKIKRARPLLGTLVEIEIDGTHESILHRVAADAFDAVERVHRLMSFHSETSDVTRLNRHAHRVPVEVDPETWKVLDLAGRVSQATEGVFDVTIGGGMMERNALPRMTTGTLDPAASFRDVELLPGNRVFFRRALAIDLGGIAKGYAIDCAVDALRAHGQLSGSVNAGGDLRVFGTTAVPVQIRSPIHPSQIGATATLRDAALATSARYPPSSGLALCGMILRPRTSAVPRRLRSASVRAATCALADALAKAVYLMRENSASVLTQFGASGFLLSNDGLCVIGGQS
jgi:thiamine biosynthesis lipoprotein